MGRSVEFLSRVRYAVQKNERLIQAREQRGWSQSKAADKIGISRVHYARLESGLVQPHGTTIGMICDAFNMSAEALGLRKFASITSRTGFIVVQQPTLRTPVVMNGTDIDIFHVSMKGLVLAQQQMGWTSDELLAQVYAEMGRLTAMIHSRRDIMRQGLGFLVGLPLAVLGFGNVVHLSAEEALPLYVTSVPAAWKLYFDGQLAEVEAALPTYISHLAALAQQPTRYQGTAKNLLSQTHQLSSLVVLEHEAFGASMSHNRQALAYSREIADPNLQLAAYIRQANTFYYRKRWSSMLQTYEEALQMVDLKRASPLSVARIYNGYAATLCKFEGQEPEALRYQALAHEVFPYDAYENDPSYGFTHISPYILHLNDTITNLDIGHTHDASTSIEQAALYIPQGANPRSLELLNHKAMVASAQGDLEELCYHLGEVITQSQALGSDLYVSSARDIIDSLPVGWQRERRMKQLMERLSY